MLANKQIRGLSFVEVDVVVDMGVKDAKVIVGGKERLNAPDLLLLFKKPGLKSFSGSEVEFLTLLFSLSAKEDDVDKNILLLLLSPAGVGKVDEKFRP